MSGFVKVYGSLLAGSSLLTECWQARLVFLEMLAFADINGRVECASVKALARVLNLSEADTAAGLAVLEAPDPASRTEVHEGRRVLRQDRGFVIVNHSKYRDFRSKTQEDSRARSVRYRQTSRDESRASRAVTQRHAPSREVSASLSASVSSSSLLSDSDARARVVMQPSEDPFTAARAQVRRAFAMRFEASEGQLWTRATDPSVDTLTSWWLSLPGDREANLAKTLDAFFADAWCRSRHFDVSHLARHPGKYFEPREAPSAGRQSGGFPEDLAALRRMGEEAVCNGESDERIKAILARIREAEAKEGGRRGR